MQKPDENKRRLILKVAGRMFAAKPFHEVRLEDIAAKCRVGKGTIYVYFKSKEDVYASLLRDGIRVLRENLNRELQGSRRPAMDDLRVVVRAVVEFSASQPAMFQLIRMVLPKTCECELRGLRQDLVGIIRGVIQRGVDQGAMSDSCPELTAQYLLSSVRGSILFGPKVKAPDLAEHLLQVFGHGLNKQNGRRL